MQKRHTTSSRIASLAMALIGLLIMVRGAAAQEQMQKSLYERLGGVYSIAGVVDNLVDRLYNNDVLNANPAIKAARDHAPKAGLKFQLTAQLCQACGGPEKYAGRSMMEAHQGMNITEKEWQSFVMDLRSTLRAFKVPEPEQKELYAIIDNTKGDIVTSVR